MDDNSIYRDLFFEETDQYLENLNSDVLRLEQSPDDIEIIHAIFRSAHTLKGMASTMGYDTMAKLTHRMENVFEWFKEEEAKINSDAISLVFDCLDTLSDIVEDLRSDGEGEVDVSHLIERLEKLSSHSPGSEEQKTEERDQAKLVPHLSALDSSDEEVVRQAQFKEYKAYLLAVRIEKESMMKSARAFLVISQLEEEGEIIHSEPSTEQLEKEEFDQDIHLLYVTRMEKDELKELISSMSGIEEVAVIEVSADLFHAEKEEGADHRQKKEAQKKETTDSKLKKPPHTLKQTIRVDLKRLDQMMNLVSELVIHRTRLEDISAKQNLHEIDEPLESVARISSELQDVVLQLRMQPFSVAVQRFPRMIRDLANDLHKEIELIIEGEDTELDRTVVTELSEPLIHLLRNSADHGIETPKEREAKGKPPKGIVKVSAYPEGNRVIVTIGDDGKGIDPAAIKASAEKKGISTDGLSDQEIQHLIFHPGFSTKEEVTGVSGRGVGMDVVKDKITQLNGIIETISEVDKGTTFRITLPLTLSIIQSLLVKAGNEVFALPQAMIEKVEKMNQGVIRTIHDSEVYSYEGKYIPVVRLDDRLSLRKDDHTNPHIVFVVIRDKYYAVVVDDIIGQKEIVIKDLGKELKNLSYYIGATILGDGQVVLILDMSTICISESAVSV